MGVHCTVQVGPALKLLLSKYWVAWSCDSQQLTYIMCILSYESNIQLFGFRALHLFVCPSVSPASVTSPFFYTIWWSRPYKPFNFCEHMIPNKLFGHPVRFTMKAELPIIVNTFNTLKVKTVFTIFDRSIFFPLSISHFQSVSLCSHPLIPPTLSIGHHTQAAANHRVHSDTKQSYTDHNRNKHSICWRCRIQNIRQYYLLYNKTVRYTAKWCAVQHNSLAGVWKREGEAE